MSTIISDNEHLEGQCPAYAMVTYKRNIKSIIDMLMLFLTAQN